MEEQSEAKEKMQEFAQVFRTEKVYGRMIPPTTSDPPANNSGANHSTKSRRDDRE